MKSIGQKAMIFYKSGARKAVPNVSLFISASAIFDFQDFFFYLKKELILFVFRPKKESELPAHFNFAYQVAPFVFNATKTDFIGELVIKFYFRLFGGTKVFLNDGL